MSDVSVPSIPQPSRISATRLVYGTLVFIALAVIGLAFVKWVPYWHKAHVAASAHAIGTSIVSGKAATPPAFGWQAGVSYLKSYFTAVWQAVVLALLLGATVQVFVPRQWLRRMLGAPSTRSAALAGALSLGGMM